VKLYSPSIILVVSHLYIQLEFRIDKFKSSSMVSLKASVILITTIVALSGNLFDMVIVPFTTMPSSSISDVDDPI
jgi:hypothetical protein